MDDTETYWSCGRCGSDIAFERYAVFEIHGETVGEFEDRRAAEGRGGDQRRFGVS